MGFETFMSGLARNLQLPQQDDPGKYMAQIQQASLQQKLIREQQAFRREMVANEQKNYERKLFAEHLPVLKDAWNNAMSLKGKKRDAAIEAFYRNYKAIPETYQFDYLKLPDVNKLFYLPPTTPKDAKKPNKIPSIFPKDSPLMKTWAAIKEANKPGAPKSKVEELNITDPKKLMDFFKGE